MKRLHVNLATSDLDASVRFYEELFGSKPTVLKEDYAKWMLEDPRVNFSLSTHAGKDGVDHLGIQAEDTNEFETMASRLRESENEIFEQPDVNCCYANSSKAWVRDPNGVAWETFVTHGDTATYSSAAEGAPQHSAREFTQPESSTRRCC